MNELLDLELVEVQAIVEGFKSLIIFLSIKCSPSIAIESSVENTVDLTNYLEDVIEGKRR